MDEHSIDEALHSLSSLRVQLARLRFWKENPEIQAVEIDVSTEYDDCEYYTSRQVSRITMVSDSLIQPFFERINLREELGDEYPESPSPSDLADYIYSIGQCLDPSGLLEDCDASGTFVRPDGELDAEIADIQEQVACLSTNLSKGATLYVVITPEVAYDDEYYSASGGGSVAGVFRSKDDALALCRKIDTHIISSYSADEVAECDWYGETNPDDVSDLDEQLAIWREHNADFMSEVVEVPLQ